jgi:hypothetical protein
MPGWAWVGVRQTRVMVMEEWNLAMVETDELLEELAGRYEWCVVLFEPRDSPENDSTLEFIFPGEDAGELYRSIGMLESAKEFALRMLSRRFGRAE